ncbi:hypothetical protein GF359_08190 [candidate division WOR-3 bacterium]|uniref:4-vinyl reductase 4VR domain-containing protein n=1 Tax=candidate division WOR-3 bacterium TaxID=2052148 RepID=A0A9D5KAM1_UNCW3|nr:hypothetical protein [candidate division WOR-3 bacterium]MBD3365180.1 hypothetical protein [candidate division WOR-3 bacterium]
MANIRGNTFVAVNEWMVKHLEGLRYERFMAKMRAPVARSLSRPEGWAWYPLEYLTEIYESIVQYLGNGKPAPLIDIGVFLAETDLGGGPKSKTSLLPMSRILPRLSFLWARYKDCGEVNVEFIDEERSKALVSITGYDGNPDHCRVNGAWIERVCKLMSGREVKAEETTCRWKVGGNTCTWEVSWQ